MMGHGTRARRVWPVFALLAAACGDAGAGPMDDDPGPLLTGTVHAVGGGSGEGLWAVWRGEGAQRADSGRVGADGRFEIRASAAGRGELLIDGPEPRSWHPILFPFGTEEVDDLALLLIPRSWRIGAGTYEGESVPTPLDPVVDDDAGQLRYTYFFGQPDPFDAPERYLLELMAWPAENLPAQVAIDHAASTAPVTPADSAAIWAVLGRMEAVAGLDLFEPAEAMPGWWGGGDGSPDDPFEPGVIRLIHDAATWRARLHGEEPARHFDGSLGAWADAGPFDAFRESHRRLNAGVVFVGAFEPYRLADGLVPWETVLIHETAHVLGLGHTFRVPSPMGPRLRTLDLSRNDAAYMELLRETLRMARELDVRPALMPSIIGERRVLLGASALPRLETQGAPARAGVFQKLTYS